jgi:hypothetical protein
MQGIIVGCGSLSGSEKSVNPLLESWNGWPSFWNGLCDFSPDVSNNVTLAVPSALFSNPPTFQRITFLIPSLYVDGLVITKCMIN